MIHAPLVSTKDDEIQLAVSLAHATKTQLRVFLRSLGLRALYDLRDNQYLVAGQSVHNAISAEITKRGGSR
jgi:hypothetical protein